MKKSEEYIAELFYFRVLDSYLLQKSDLRDNYEMLVDHYTKYPKSLIVLTKKDLLRLKKMQDDINSNKYSLFSGTIDFNEELPGYKEKKTDINHADLCNRVVRDKKTIESILGPIHSISREHPTLFGPIDILAQSKDTAFIIEVKTIKADHSIIGQVMKYFIAVSLKLNLRHYDDVKMITLCPGYDKASYFGLKQIGAMPLIINTNTIEINELESESDNNL